MLSALAFAMILRKSDRAWTAATILLVFFSPDYIMVGESCLFGCRDCREVACMLEVACRMLEADKIHAGSRGLVNWFVLCCFHVFFPTLFPCPSEKIWRVVLTSSIESTT